VLVESLAVPPGAMARSRLLRMTALTLANILLPIAVLVFATGFFPYKPFFPGLATFEDVQDPNATQVEQPEAVFDRVIFMVVDALRSDFVYGYNSGFEFTQKYVSLSARRLHTMLMDIIA
jgi:ethanolamine phosphate transferase 2 subunit G